MQRLVEQPTDDGEVFEGSVRVGRVHYHLAVYQQFSDTEDEPVPANFDVEGRITPLDGLDLSGLTPRSSELTLHMADGRALDFSLVDEEGRIRSTGRGLYR
jgi:hypothetical protein